MSKDTVTIYKLFWADQDVEQEQWLREQARAGLHLKSPAFFCGWTFSRGAPTDTVYRIDYRGSRSAHYQRLFEDAGWELAGESAGWQYWRKLAAGGKADEIFTDNDSKISKYRRVLMMLAIGILPLTAVLLGADINKFMEKLSTPTMVLLAIVVTLAYPIYTYAALRLFKRIRALREQAV